MAYIQKNVPPPNKILTFSLKNFAGGLNNRSEILAPSEASDLMNMKFSNDTIMEKRNGTEKYDDVKLNEPVTFIHEFRPYRAMQDVDPNADDGTEDYEILPDKLLRASDKEMYADDKKLTDVAGRVTGVNYNGKFIFVDGDKIRVYGKFPQFDRTYEKIIGTPVDELIVFELVDPPKDYTPLTTEHVRGIVRYDYTNKKMWYEPCQLEMEDTYTGSNVLPKKPKYIVVHKGRLFVTGSEKDDDNVFITDIQNPYYFPVYLPIQLPPNSDMVRGLIVFDDGVVIGREFDLFVITGMTNRTDAGVDVFRLRKINSHTGVSSHYSMCTAHNYLFFFGNDGVAYALASVRTDEKTLATTIISRQIDIEKDPIGLYPEDLADACTVFYGEEWYVSAKDKVLVYSYRNRAWTIYNQLNIRSFYVKGHDLIFGNESGQTVQFSTFYLDQDVPYIAYWKSRWFDMDDANANKQFREFYLVGHTYDDLRSDIRVTFEIDYVDVKDEIIISNQIAVFGKARFGDRFIMRNINQSLPFVIGRRGRSIRFTFTNGFFLNQPVETRADLEKHSNKREGAITLIKDENVYVLYRNREWQDISRDDINQGMKVYQVNGDYEFRGKR